MSIEIIGWDIGGAHLKAAALGAGGRVLYTLQHPCPLWRGLVHLEQALTAVRTQLPADCARHAVTMSGELVDLFQDRAEGVTCLLATLSRCLGAEASIEVFAGHQGFVAAAALTPAHHSAVASANWLASSFYVASRLEAGLLVDIGSTTTDILLIEGGEVRAQGFSDFDRLGSGELIYSGLVRTPLMALASHVRFEGRRVGVMAEHFATCADVFRLCGELPEAVDQMPSADGREKTREASARRLARMIGRDLESAAMASWRQLAGYFRERQLRILRRALERQLRRTNAAEIPLIGAGVGQFLVAELAERLQRPYRAFDSLLETRPGAQGMNPGDCAPAVCVAQLALAGFEGSTHLPHSQLL